MIETKIYQIFSDTPIDILKENDDDEEDYHLLCSNRWVLVKPRLDGSINIGLFNVWLANLTLSNNFNLDIDSDDLITKLVEICETLVSQGLLKETPEYKRVSFKLITNEEFNGKRTEREDNS